jgi:hypothetical protein
MFWVFNQIGSEIIKKSIGCFKSALSAFEKTRSIIKKIKKWNYIKQSKRELPFRIKERAWSYSNVDNRSEFGGDDLELVPWN